MEEKAGGFISKIIFNNGAALDVEKNGIVVFVGPNNVGKSQALKDITRCLEIASHCMTRSSETFPPRRIIGLCAACSWWSSALPPG